jgi:hypothetical protein
MGAENHDKHIPWVRRASFIFSLPNFLLLRQILPTMVLYQWNRYMASGIFAKLGIIFLV